MTGKNELLKEYAKNLGAENSARKYVTLEGANSEDPLEFEIYGNRLVAFLCQRFQHYADDDLAYLTVLEIGCGMGRLLKPLCHRFETVFGVDMSARILESAKSYLQQTPNVFLFENEGLTLSNFETGKFDCVLCTGVMQHMPKREIIAGYLSEGMRVLKDGGLYQFSFQVWQTELEGKARVGAKFSAAWLNEVFSKLNGELLELTCDPLDPVPHYTAMVRKTDGPFKGDFGTHPVQKLPWRTKCWADLDSMAEHKKLQAQGQRRITFLDPD